MTAKLKYRTTLGGCRCITIDADQGDEVDVCEVFQTPQLVTIATDTGDIEISLAEAEALVPILQDWIEYGRLPEEPKPIPELTPEQREEWWRQWREMMANPKSILPKGMADSVFSTPGLARLLKEKGKK